MQRIATTVLALVGSPPRDELRALAERLGAAANVRAVVPAAEQSPLDRAVAAWTEAARAHIPYLIHEADPLSEVAAAWTARWDGAGDVGRLELAVQAVVERWRARSLELPDYYLVVAPEALPPTARHWHLGILQSAAPHRVAVADASTGEIGRAIRRLRAGRWWPELDQLLADIDRRVPDALHLSEPATGLVL